MAKVIATLASAEHCTQSAKSRPIAYRYIWAPVGLVITANRIASDALVDRDNPPYPKMGATVAQIRRVNS